MALTAMTKIRFPEDQQEGTEATLAKWLKAPGEAVAVVDAGWHNAAALIARAAVRDDR